MSSRRYEKSLEKEGLIKRCPVDYKAIAKLLTRARIDVRTAKRNLREDPECAYNYAYNAMLRMGLGLMFSEGFRPDIKDKHLTIVKFAGSVLGDEFGKLVNDYDFMRRKRHRFIYEPGIPCSLKEATHSITVAEEFVAKVSSLIKTKVPEIQLKLGDQQEERTR
jgi:uncharacterized protein (UPF0332 family)